MSGLPGEGSDSRSENRLTIFRSAAAVTVMTLLSRVLGLVREQVRSYYLGTGMSSDAFGLAATIPNLFRRLLAEGAMTAAFVPVLAGYVKKGDRQELGAFLSSFLTLFTFVTTLVCVLGVVFADFVVTSFFSSAFGQVEGKVALTVLLTELMFPYLLFVSVAAIIQALLNSFRIFAPSAFTPVLLNLLIIVAAVVGHDLFPDPSYAFAAGFLVGGVVQLAFQVPWLVRLKIPIRFSLKWNHPGVRELFRVFLPGLFGAGIYQINVFVAQIIASSLSAGSIASLQYSLRLQELVLGLFVISVTTVILPAMSAHHAGGDRQAFTDTNVLALDMLALVTIPSTAAMIALRDPVVALLFQQGAFDSESTRMTCAAVLFHSLGIYFIATSRSLNQTFNAMKDLKTPAIVAAVAMVVNIAGCYLLSIPLGHGGIALASSLSAAVTAVALFGLLVYRRVDVGLRHHLWLLLRVTLAAGVMFGALLLSQHLLPPAAGKMAQAGQLAVHLLVAVVAFIGAALVLVRTELGQLARLATTRIRRRGR